MTSHEQWLENEGYRVGFNAAVVRIAARFEGDERAAILAMYLEDYRPTEPAPEDVKAEGR
jgi:hypothetical protein